MSHLITFLLALLFSVNGSVLEGSIEIRHSTLAAEETADQQVFRAATQDELESIQSSGQFSVVPGGSMRLPGVHVRWFDGSQQDAQTWAAQAAAQAEGPLHISKWRDINGFYWDGDRNLEPVAQSWLSPDPLGHDADPSLYTFSGGNPVNYFDPDGRLATTAGLTDGADLAHSSAWHGEWVDPMETCQLGLRPYGLVGSYWYAADSLGHNADPSLYAFCANGNPVNYFDPDGRLATTAGLDESDANRSVGVFQGLCAQGVALHDAPESIADWLCGGGDCQPTRGTMTDAINAYGESLLGATDPSIHEQMEGQLLSYIITTLAIPGAGEEEMETGASASWLNNIRTTTAAETTAGQTYQIMDGVRRATAANLTGATTIDAEILDANMVSQGVQRIFEVFHG